MDDNSVADNIFIHVAVVVSQICKVTRNAPKIRTCDISRSSKVIDLDANQKHIMQLAISHWSNFGRISYRFRDIDAKTRKLFTSPNPCLTPLAEERPAISVQSTHRWKLF